MTAASPPLQLLRTAWSGRRSGTAIRYLGGTILAIVFAELAFGHASSRHLGPLPVPVGIPLGVILNGAIIGILYGLVGIGLILVFRANRIISFAQAGLGGVPALLGLLLINYHHWSYIAGVLVMLVGSVLTGFLVEVLLLRKFSARPRIIATVATIGVAQTLTFLELKLPDWVSGNSVTPFAFPTPFSGFTMTVGGTVFNGNHLAVIVAGGAMAVGLAAFFARTRIGIAVRGAAENGDRAWLLGIPVASLSTLVWMIAGLCSGIAIFLRASVVGLPFGGIGFSPVVLLYGLAAATVAGMQRMRVAMAAGMLIGVLEQTSVFGTSKPDLAAALMLPLILVALLPRARRAQRALDTGMQTIRTLIEFRPIPTELRHLREVRVLRIVGLVLVAAIFLAAPLYTGAGGIGFATQVVIYAMVALSVVILSGWAGQISLGQYAFAGIGAAVAGGLAANHGQDFWVTMLAAGGAGALLAVLIGLPSLRTQGLYLAVVTLAFAATTQDVLINPDFAGWLLPTQFSHVNRPVLWQRIDVTGGVSFYFLCVAFLLLAYMAARSIRRSRSGRTYIATRDNVRAAQSFGISSTRTRLAAFAISGFVAALAGGLLAYQQGIVDYRAFELTATINLFIIVVIGGLTSPGGAIAGALIYEGIQTVAQNGICIAGHCASLSGFDTIGIAAGVLTMLTFAPGGFAQLGFDVRDRILRRIATRRQIIVPSLLADRAIDTVPPRVAAAVAAESSPGALLTCRGVDVSYDSVQVLFGVDLEVREGEIVALLGTNGAGKSTLLRAISGLTLPRRGQILFDGQDITRLSPTGRVAMGIIQVPGGRSIFPTLTVAEHFALARWLVRDEAADTRQQRILDELPKLRLRYDQLAGNLSGGEQQMLGLAMAFVAKPRLLLIDELSLGLAPMIVDQLLHVVEELKGIGTTVVLVEQSVNVALNVADRAYFMEKGEVRFEGAAKDLLERDDIMRSVFLQGVGSTGDSSGSAPSPASRTRRTAATDAPAPGDEEAVPALQVEDLSVHFGGVRAVAGVSLAVSRREILGIIGPNGAGKTSLFDLISGFQQPDSGRILLNGRDVTAWPPDDRAWAGLGRSFQDARLFSAMTVAEAIATAFERHIPVHDHVAPALGLPAAREAERDVAWSVADLIELVSLQAYRDKFVHELSTGTRRIVDLAMVMAHDPTVLILDEPSSGIAQREVEALASVLERIRSDVGCGMVIIEHDIPLVSSISDRLMVMDLGAVIAQGDPATVMSDAAVVAAYLGADERTIKRSGAHAALSAAGRQ